MIKKCIWLSGFIFLSILTSIDISSAQNLDTLNLAKDLRNTGKVKESLALLKKYFENNKKELYAGWIYADALYKNKKYKESSEIYAETINRYPKNTDLRLDFAIKSTEIGNLKAATYHLNKLNHNLSKDYKFAVKKTLAKVYFWQGDYERSLSNINAALNIYKNDEESLNLKSDIKKIQSNWMKIDASYMDNNQPLTRMSPDIEMGFYHNSRLSTDIGINTSFYSKDYKLHTGGEIDGKVIYRFLNAKASLELGIGLIRLPSNEYNIGTSFSLKKKLFKNSEFQANYKYAPYLATKASIDKKVMQNIFEMSFERKNTDSWMGKLSFTLNNFPSVANSQYTLSSWVVSPSLKLSKFRFRLGYGFNYSDSKKNSFNSTLSLNELLALKDTAIIINGAYDPFFSPKNQKIHSVIGMISYNPFFNTNIGVSINYGAIASSDIPYLFLDNNKNGVLQINRSYFHNKYNPLEINGFISYELPNEVSVKAYYMYQKTSYYTSYVTGLTTKFLF
ncbi:MAG TPA: hypothetical protein ENK91_12185 [Bacteroidetes bacterium]|nr:hypothetical protein [Bacteroidota bacterium]